MAGQLVKRQENLSIDITSCHLVFETIFQVTRSQNVRIEFTLVNPKLYFSNDATQPLTILQPPWTISTKISLLGPNVNNEDDAPQLLTYTPQQDSSFITTRQFFHPESGALTLAPGHYVVTVQIREHLDDYRNPLVLKAQKAYLAISGMA